MDEAALLKEITWFLREHCVEHLESSYSLLGACFLACQPKDQASSSSEHQQIFSKPHSRRSSHFHPANQTAATILMRSLSFQEDRDDGLRIETPYSPITSSSATLVLSTVGSNVLKGFVTLDGPNIEKAEIQMHFAPLNRGHVATMVKDPAVPSPQLPQVVRCGQLIRIALEELKIPMVSLIDCRDDQHQSLLQLHVGLDRTINRLEQALCTLQSGSQISLPLIHPNSVDQVQLLFSIRDASIVAQAIVPGGSFENTNIAQEHFTSDSPRGRASTRGSIVSISSPASTPKSKIGKHPTEGTVVEVESVVPSLMAVKEIVQDCLRSLLRLRTQSRNLMDIYDRHLRLTTA